MKRKKKHTDEPSTLVQTQKVTRRTDQSSRDLLQVRANRFLHAHILVFITKMTKQRTHTRIDSGTMLHSVFLHETENPKAKVAISDERRATTK